MLGMLGQEKQKKTKSKTTVKRQVQTNRENARGDQAAERQRASNRSKERATAKRERTGAAGSIQSKSELAVKEHMKKTDLGALSRAVKAKRKEKRKVKKPAKPVSTTTTTTVPAMRRRLRR